MTARFLLDENVSPTLRDALIREDPNSVVHCVGDPGVPPRATPDPDIIAWCEVQGLMLLTHNRRTMPGHLADHLAGGQHVPGIIILPTHWSIRQLVDELMLVVGATLPGELEDQISHLPMSF